MDNQKVIKFLELAGQQTGFDPLAASADLRKLSAQLLLSETLEYIVHGLGVQLKVGECEITDPDALTYDVTEKAVDKKEMLDGLADVAYTMYWNQVVYNLPLEEAYALVCDNNLEKFVMISDWSGPARELESNEWDLGKDVSWPPEVVSVSVIAVGDEFYAVGKDASGKVRKPSTYQSVDLDPLL